MSQDLQEYIQMLNSSDPAERKKAIVALGKSGDPRALKPLAKVYKTDSDKSLRQLALKAGKYLQKQTSAAEAPKPASDQGLQFISAQEEGGSSGAGEQAAPSWMDKMGEEVQKPKKVSERDRKRAASLREQALDAQTKGDAEKVVELLAAAIDLNPALEKDSMVLGMLAGATGLDAEQAMRELKRINAQEAASGKKRKAAQTFDWSETIEFVTEMLIGFVIMGLFASGGIFLTLNDLNWDTQREQATSQEELEAIDEAEELFDQFGPLASLIIGFVYGGIVTAAALVMSFLAWMTGSMFLGGTGLMFPFLQGMMRVAVGMLFVSTFLSYLGGFFASDSQVGALIGLAPLVLGIGLTAWTIGKIHGFGMMTGCVNMVVTVFACGFLSCGCSFLMAI